MTTDLLKEVQEEAPLIQLVSFIVDKEEYAVDILRVQEILRIRKMARVPKAPHFIKGVINLRGKIVPIMDLRIRMGMPPIKSLEDSRIIVVNQSDKIVGLIVDSMSEVLSIPESIIHPAPTTSNIQSSDEHIQGVAKLEDRLMILLNLETLFDDQGL